MIESRLLVLDNDELKLGSRLPLSSFPNVSWHSNPEDVQALHAEVDLIVMAESEDPAVTSRHLATVMTHSTVAPVIVVRQGQSAQRTAQLIQSGATDVFDISQENAEARFRQTLEHSLEVLDARHRLEMRSSIFHDEEHQFFLGTRASMAQVGKLILQAASTDASVFITGENGTGKEVTAQLIHRFSGRAEQNFVPVNCAAIPTGLVESELFGHVKGSFTGATNTREGLAMDADGGTLFLDEVGEMEFPVQAKLLRFAQFGTFTPVGGNEPRVVNTRLISATNRDPRVEVVNRQFREDLFYRLNVIQIHMPPLRGRCEDIEKLAMRFLQEFCMEENKKFNEFSPETLEVLLDYPWPGNVRELQNVVRNVVALHDGSIVIPSMLPLYLIQYALRRELEPYEPPVREMSEPPTDEIRPLDQLIDQAIENALEVCEGSVPKAAGRLGVNASTIYRRRARAP